MGLCEASAYANFDFHHMAHIVRFGLNTELNLFVSGYNKNFIEVVLHSGWVSVFNYLYYGSI